MELIVHMEKISFLLAAIGVSWIIIVLAVGFFQGHEMFATMGGSGASAAYQFFYLIPMIVIGASVIALSIKK